MSENIANVPKIRFPGFTDAWEQRKAADVFKTTADKNHPKLPVLSATQECGMILREDTGINISYDKKNEATYKRVLPGQFVIHLRSFQGGFAHSNAEGITSPAYTVMDFVEKEKHYDFFWKYIFSSKKFIKSLEKVTYGIRDGRSISYNDFSTMSFLFPSCGEQKAIGQFFQNLDHLITLHQRKLDHLRDEKKSLLQKMFPKNGEDVPEIRFPGFTHAWEQRKAADVFKTTADKNHPKLPVLSATQECGMILREDTGINISYDKKNEATYKRVLPGQFVIHLRSFQGGFAHSNAEGITSPAYTVMDFVEKEKHYDFFWKYIFSSKKFIKSLEKVTYGIRDGRSISYNDFSTMSFLFPSCGEQKAIGQFFQNLDHLITLHQRKLNHLQEQKKSLLQQMFV